MSPSSEKPNIVVIGGSWVGSNAAQLISAKMHGTHKTVMIEKNTHFNNLFAFPRYAVVPKYEHRAFIPYSNMFSDLPSDAVFVHRGSVTEIHADRVVLEGDAPIPYEYLVVATGTRLTPPGNVLTHTKPGGIAYFQAHQQAVENAQKIVIIGGGANGVRQYFSPGRLGSWFWSSSMGFFKRPSRLRGLTSRASSVEFIFADGLWER